jgi:hypothetical protein
MPYLNVEHEHSWMAVTTLPQQEYNRWICVICGQKSVQIVPGGQKVEVDQWPWE